ncbi:MAG: CBS domain-containing protein [Methanobacteriota archaeon]|nr:MAG: CBS domain-containing protein [Euryarchaeota archaeon]
MALVKNIMSKPAVTVQPSATIYDAARQMKDAKIGSLIITDDKDRPLGIITETDIIYKVVAEGRALDTPVKDVMTTDLKTIDEEETVEKAAKIMAAHLIRRLPVVKNKKLTGIVALKDVVKAKKVNSESEYYPYYT